jgi:SUR7/PalI family
LQAATSFTIISALISTILYSTLVGAMTGFLKEYGISFSLGTHMLALEWIAVAFSLGASLFWTITICCCSGKSSRKNRDNQPSGFIPFGSRGYAPLGEQGQHHSNAYVPPPATGHEMQDFGYTGAGYKGRETAYEPFRHA